MYINGSFDVNSMLVGWLKVPFAIKNHKWQYSQRLFELNQLFMYNFLSQTVPQFAFYILFTYYSNYLLPD